MDEGLISLIVMFQMFPVIMIPLAIMFFALYFLPIFIAFWRGHPYRWVICLITLFVGFTTIGWLVALVWSVLPIPAPQPAPLPPQRYEPNFNEPIIVSGRETNTSSPYRWNGIN